MGTNSDISIKELFPLLLDHISESKDDMTSIRESLARIETTSKHTIEKLNIVVSEATKAEERIKKLETSRDMMSGIIAFLGFLGLTGIIEYFKHFK